MFKEALNTLFDEKDFFYNKKYAELYLSEGSSIVEFRFEEGGKYFYNLSIKRPIYKIKDIPLEKIYYDLETPYGFSGYYTNTTDKEFVKKALNEYTDFCRSQNIIAEFIRFHPLNSFPSFFSEYLDFVCHDRDVVLVDLTKPKELRWSNYKHITRRKIRKASESLKFIPFDVYNQTYLSEFFMIYNQTMQKNNADKFYYFPESFFKDLLINTPSKLFITEINDSIASGAIFVESAQTVSYLLGAKNYSLNITGSMELLLDNIFDYYQNIGKKIAILGGGRSNKPDDTLYRFKRGFSDIIAPFFISGKIFIKEVYDKYCRLANFNNNRFLKYRYE